MSAAIESIRQPPNFMLLPRILIEVGRSGEHPPEQKSRIHGRQLTLPSALSCLHVEKVVIETFVACGICVRALLARGEEAQLPQRSFDRLFTSHEVAFDSDGIGGQSHADSGNARRPS